MDKKEKEHIRQEILKKIHRQKLAVETFANLVQPISPDNAIGRITRMEAINSKSINEAALAKAKQSLKSLEKTLKRMDDPEFGYCRNCEEAIPLKRLIILPDAPFCVACAQKTEIK